MDQTKNQNKQTSSGVYLIFFIDSLTNSCPTYRVPNDKLLVKMKLTACQIIYDKSSSDASQVHSNTISRRVTNKFIRFMFKYWVGRGKKRGRGCSEPTKLPFLNHAQIGFSYFTTHTHKHAHTHTHTHTLRHTYIYI